MKKKKEKLKKKEKKEERPRTAAATAVAAPLLFSSSFRFFSSSTSGLLACSSLASSGRPVVERTASRTPTGFPRLQGIPRRILQVSPQRKRGTERGGGRLFHSSKAVL